MADADLSGTVLDGRYQVIEPIAEGAMGSVYRGERLKLGRAVAIKIMHQELPDELASRQRFEREAKLMALLEHPNCVSVIDFGVHEDKPFLVMDLVRGTSLIDLMEKTGPIEVARAADIVRQVLSGLAHAHELGIVHRDIKPANIMISEKAGLGQQVRILDFGLARLAESTATKLTTGIVVGTPNYMAPEQCKGSDIDARTDIYACGVVLFEMLTGRKPFVADDPIAVVRKHLLEPAPTLASVEPRVDFGELEAVVAKALAKAPKDRFDNAVEMSKALEAAAAAQAKTSAAALFARAVPEGASDAVGTQQATMSGWTVPPDARSSAIPSSDVRGVIPGVTTPGPFAPLASGAPAPSAPAASPPGAPAPRPPSAPGVASGPTAGVANVGDASGPFTGTAKLDDSAHAANVGPSGSTAFGGTPPSTNGSSTLPDRANTSSTIVDSGASESATSVDSAAGAATNASATFIEGRGDVSPVALPVPASSLPPLPQAKPYVPPPVTPGAAPIAPPSSSGGAPDAAMDIPTTRPSTVQPMSPAAPRPAGAAGADRPIPQLPLTKKQLMIAGGGLLGLILLIALVAGGGDDKKQGTTKTTGGTAVTDKAATDDTPVAQTAERATSLIESEDYEEAVELLKKARKAHPESAELAFLAGKAYFGQLWWTDGVESFRDAIALDSSYKENPDLLKTVLKGFLTTPDVDDRIVDFMRHDIGKPLRPYLEETAETHPKKHLRARARAELNAR